MNNALASKLAFCETYDRCGWSMTPTHGKAAYRPDWPCERLGCESMAEILAASPRDNIGVLLGEPSGWLIDIDLDHPLAVEMASDYLPSTGAIFGRAGNVRSHWLYSVTAPIATTQHRLHGTNQTIVELRSTGGQTVFPPSQHPSGEAIEWDTDGEPASIDPTELSAAVSRLADAVREKLGVTSAATPKTNGHAPQHRNRAPLDVNRWLTSHAVPILQYGTLADGSSFWLIPCPGIRSHTNENADTDCRITQEPSGRLGGGCFHQSCGMHSWRDIADGIGKPTRDDYPTTLSQNNGRGTDQPHSHRSPNENDTPCLKIRSSGELISDFQEMRPPIVDGLLRSGETMNIIAAPKTGKSWLSMGLGLSVVSGRQWLNRFWTRRGKVLIVDNELHAETSAHRLPLIADAMGIQPGEYSDQLFVASLRGQLIDLNALAGQLSSLEAGAFSLIILDAWYRFAPPFSDENSNSDVSRLYNLLDAVANKLGSAFVCIHHTSKGSQSSKGVTDVGSGAGAQSRAPDSHLTIRQHEADGAFVVEAAVRSFAPPQPFCVRWDFPIWAPADDLDPKDLRQERPRKAKGPATSSGESSEDARQRAADENRQKVLDAYATFPDGETINSLRDAAGMSGAVFGPINSALIREGIVEARTVQKSRREFDGFRLVTISLGHSDKTLFSVSESELSDKGLAHRRTSPPL